MNGQSLTAHMPYQVCRTRFLVIQSLHTCARDVCHFQLGVAVAPFQQVTVHRPPKDGQPFVQKPSSRKCAQHQANTHCVTLTVTGLQFSSSTVSTCPATEGRCHSLRPPLLMRPRSRLLPATTSTSHTPGTPARPSGTLWRHLHSEVGALNVMFVSIWCSQQHADSDDR